MALRIDFDGFWDWGTTRRIEGALRQCLGDPPSGEEWSVSVTSFGSYCVVLVKTNHQTRRKLFLLHPFELTEAIPNWLKQYPLQ
jgi:hypothetical protein